MPSRSDSMASITEFEYTSTDRRPPYCGYLAANTSDGPASHRSRQRAASFSDTARTRSALRVPRTFYFTSAERVAPTRRNARDGAAVALHAGDPGSAPIPWAKARPPQRHESPARVHHSKED